MHATVPYCGAPPVPGELWRSWNADPVLLLALAVCALGALACRRPERTAIHAGLLAVAAVTVSPLCRLGVALFSVRVGTHLLLAVVAAPLLARGLRLRAPSPPLAGLAFATMLWTWHLPGPYDATLRNDAVYWAAQLSLLASAVWLWSGLLAGSSPPLGAVALALATSAQMGLLGALLTFAPAARFASHLTTTTPWGLTPLEDQQLGGLLCWIPGGAVFLGAGLAATAALLRDGRAALARA
jgi:putative membrane protein